MEKVVLGSIIKKNECTEKATLRSTGCQPLKGGPLNELEHWGDYIDWE